MKHEANLQTSKSKEKRNPRNYYNPLSSLCVPLFGHIGYLLMFITSKTQLSGTGGSNLSLLGSVPKK